MSQFFILIFFPLYSHTFLCTNENKQTIHWLKAQGWVSRTVHTELLSCTPTPAAVQQNPGPHGHPFLLFPNSLLLPSLFGGLADYLTLVFASLLLSRPRSLICPQSLNSCTTWTPKARLYAGCGCRGGRHWGFWWQLEGCLGRLHFKQLI